MSHHILPFTFALFLALLWVIYMPRVVLRLSGVAVSWNPFRRLLQVRKVTLGKYILEVGLLTVGVACLTFDLSNRYMRWTMYGNPSDRLTFGRLTEVILGCVFVGVFYGLLTGFMDIRRSRG